MESESRIVPLEELERPVPNTHRRLKVSLLSGTLLMLVVLVFVPFADGTPSSDIVVQTLISIGLFGVVYAIADAIVERFWS